MTRLDERGVITPCPSCGQANRIPYGKEARCGKCQAALPQPSTPLEVPTSPAFDALVRDSRLPILVDFWAPWCGPCRAVAPEMAKVAQHQAGRWLVVKVNTEALPELGTRFGIRSIPTMAVFHEGHERQRTSGARPAPQIEAFVTEALS